MSHPPVSPSSLVFPLSPPAPPRLGSQGESLASSARPSGVDDHPASFCLPLPLGLKGPVGVSVGDGIGRTERRLAFGGKPRTDNRRRDPMVTVAETPGLGFSGLQAQRSAKAFGALSQRLHLRRLPVVPHSPEPNSVASASGLSTIGLSSGSRAPSFHHLLFSPLYLQPTVLAATVAPSLLPISTTSFTRVVCLGLLLPPTLSPTRTDRQEVRGEETTQEPEAKWIFHRGCDVP